MYNIVPTVNNIVLYTLKYVKRIDFTLSVLIKKEKKNHKGTEGNP